MFSFSLANGIVRSLLLTVIGLSLLATVTVPVVGAEETFDPRTIREATTAFQDVTMAEAAGYALLPEKDGITCIDNPDEGTMGIHYANDESQLVGVEYVVFQEGWDAANDVPPQLYGQEFMLTSAENRYGLPAFYSLHAWVLKANLRGDFSMWNPKVSRS